MSNTTGPDAPYKLLGQFTQSVFGYGVVLEQVNLEGLAEAPVTLVAEPPPAQANSPLFSWLLFEAGTEAYTSSGTFSIGYEGEPTLLASAVSSTILTGTVNTVQKIPLSVTLAATPAVDLGGRGIELSMTAAPAGGNGTLYVCTYFIDPFCSY